MISSCPVSETGGSVRGYGVHNTQMGVIFISSSQRIFLRRRFFVVFANE